MTRRPRIEDLTALAPPGQPALAPDGGAVVYVRVLPDPDGTDPDRTGGGLAVVLLTNGGHARDLYYDLYREILAKFAGVAMPAAIEPPAADSTPYPGRYERAGVLIEVLAGTGPAGGPTLRTTVTGPPAELVPDPTDEYAMTPAGPGRWLVREPGTRTWAPVTCYALPTGEKYLHYGSRATPRA